MFHVPSLESLESRRLFTGASVSHGILHVNGSETNHNIITVANSKDGKAVDVSISWVTPSHVKKNFSASFLKTLGFSKINIFGGSRKDTVNVGLVNGNLGIRTRIETFQSDDTITTGGERDVIYAGRGNDTVLAGGGADLVYGGLGDDNLSGEGGNDTCWGGNGTDIVDGGAGNDKLGGLGKNTLLGRAGKDTFVAKSLGANPTNDYNPKEDVLVIVGAKSDDVDAPDGVAV